MKPGDYSTSPCTCSTTPTSACATGIDSTNGVFVAASATTAPTTTNGTEADGTGMPDAVIQHCRDAEKPTY